LEVERRRETINYSTRELYDVGAARKSKESQGLQPSKVGYAATWVVQKVTIRVIIHDVMLDLRPNVAGDRHLRHDLWERFGKICRQESINELDLWELTG